MIVLNFDVENYIYQNCLFKSLERFFLHIPLVFGKEGLLFQFESSLFDLAHIIPKFLFLLLKHKDSLEEVVTFISGFFEEVI